MKNNQTVIKIVQELLKSQETFSITPFIISSKIEDVIKLFPMYKENLDREYIIDELTRRFSVWIGNDYILKDKTGHQSWITAQRSKDWKYWQRYREYLENYLSDTAIQGVDKSTNDILDLLEDPLNIEDWDRRGLVVGNVQSGKTGNYTGLICKAADAGYKIIIVLAGLHNNLRSQTQIRLDEGFLGYETSAIMNQPVTIGVGLIDADPKIRPHYVTTRADKGDFNTRIANQLGITPEKRPCLFVVKKNKTVLERLNAWISNRLADTIDQSGKKKVSSLPLLLIDDEADNASIDTADFINEDGTIDLEHEPTAINSNIRKILHSFNHSAYVGYTATPFANIFIHENAETDEEGPDLFPSAFIINLSTPSNYIGPVKVFGRASPEGRIDGLPLIREIKDSVSNDVNLSWITPVHKNGCIPMYQGKCVIPPSLEEAILSFIISCSIRKTRGQGDKHCSMLIHVTRLTSVQEQVYIQVDNYLSNIRQRILRNINSEEIIQQLCNLWTNDFIKTKATIIETNPDLIKNNEDDWNRIIMEIPSVISDIKIKKINGTAKDVLDYEEHKNNGLKVIAIGGDKLSRGLTLEGLCVSYFLRAAKMYDTLMQMGRWFGYRTGYIDLCRLFTTPELVEWFGYINDATEELREQFEIMADRGATPKDYGLKVQAHSTLMVTSRIKMRTARDLWLSFSGDLLSTVTFYESINEKMINLNAFFLIMKLIDSGNESKQIEKNGQKWSGYIGTGIHSQNILSFLDTYVTHPCSYKVQSRIIADFIRSMNQIDELTDWTVALIGAEKGAGPEFPIEGEKSIRCLIRSPNGSFSNGRYSIGTLISPWDECIDINEQLWEIAMEKTLADWEKNPHKNGKEIIKPKYPRGSIIREIRGYGSNYIKPAKQHGLLLLYLIVPNTPEQSDFAPFVGFAVSFPGSDSSKKVLYKANNVQWEEINGPAE